ncbi:MAG: hypothetical protein ACK5VI_00505 [Opitutia bacterium]|jgi:hypothetical protein
MTAAAAVRAARLRTFHALVATLAGSTPELRRDIDAVLRVVESEILPAEGLDAHALARAARQILGLILPADRTPDIAVLDYRDRPFDPLWASAEMTHALAPVDGSNDILLWVAGLQDQLLGRGRGARREAAYAAAVETLGGIAGRLAGRRRVTVVVL